MKAMVKYNQTYQWRSKQMSRSHILKTDAQRKSFQFNSIQIYSGIINLFWFDGNTDVMASKTICAIS